MKKNMNKVKTTTTGQTKSKAQATTAPQNGKRKKRFKLAHNVVGAGFTSFFFRYRHQNDLLGHATLLTFDRRLHYHHRLN